MIRKSKKSYNFLEKNNILKTFIQLVCVELRGQLSRNRFSATTQILGTELSHQPWRQVPLSAEPSSWASPTVFHVQAGNIGKLLLELSEGLGVRKQRIQPPCVPGLLCLLKPWMD